MTEKLIIHAGFPKTGTTSLQASLASARESLIAQGVHYPKRHGSAQHSAAWALTERVFGWEGRGGKATPISAWTDLVKEVQKTKERVLISSEFLSHATPAQVKRVKNDFAIGDTTIVFTLRAITKILPSRYQQSLKKGNVWGYHDWLKMALHLDGAPDSKIRFGNYSKILRRWSDVFGIERVKLVVVDESMPNLIFDSFHDILEIQSGTLQKVEDRGLNRSLTWPEAVLLSHLNLAFKDKGSWNEYATMVRNNIVKSWTGTKAPENAEKILTPTWAIEAVRGIALKNIDEIRSLGIEIVGDIELLASTSVPTGENSSSDVIPVELATQSLFALQKRHKKQLKLHKRSLVQIARNLVRKVRS
ncbi:MAG: hypothetical protein ACO3P3_03680 [Candidatus Nanopelagicales bacterium]